MSRPVRRGVSVMSGKTSSDGRSAGSAHSNQFGHLGIPRLCIMRARSDTPPPGSRWPSSLNSLEIIPFSSVCLRCCSTLFIRNETQRGGRGVTPQELVNLVNHEGAVVLDVRDSKEFAAGHIVDAVNVPHGALESRLAELEKYKDEAGDDRLQDGAARRHGGHDVAQGRFRIEVSRLSGGMTEWRNQNLPVVKGCMAAADPPSSRSNASTSRTCRSNRRARRKCFANRGSRRCNSTSTRGRQRAPRRPLRSDAHGHGATRSPRPDRRS